MSETIDAIHDRLSPRRLVSSATETVKTRMAGANRVPTALLGAAAALGVAAWMRSRSRRPRHAGFAGARAARTGSFTFGRRNRRAVLMGVCTGIACWGASRARRESTT
jgi:hypothetical protein